MSELLPAKTGRVKLLQEENNKARGLPIQSCQNRVGCHIVTRTREYMNRQFNNNMVLNGLGFWQLFRLGLAFHSVPSALVGYFFAFLKNHRIIPVPSGFLSLLKLRFLLGSLDRWNRLLATLTLPHLIFRLLRELALIEVLSQRSQRVI